MSEELMYTCQCQISDNETCNRKFSEVEYKLTEDTDSCILHCSKSNLNNWYEESEGKNKKWDEKRTNYFWNVYEDNQTNPLSLQMSNSIIPPILKYKFNKTASLFRLN